MKGSMLKRQMQHAILLLVSMLSSTSEDLGEAFTKEMVAKFREGYNKDRDNKDIFRICTTDPVLLQIRKMWWNRLQGKEDKKKEVRTTVMTDMRRLAAIYSEMKNAEKSIGREMPEEEGNISDIFKRSNFRHLEESIERCTTDGTNVKAGLKTVLYYLLKSASKVIRGRVGYQTDKGNQHLVPVLFPQDCISGLRKLADKSIRKACRIAEENDYLFPTLRGCTHVSGRTGTVYQLNLP